MIGASSLGRLARQRHAATHQRRGLLGPDSTVGEAGERGLVTRGDRDVSPGIEERLVYAQDRRGVVLEQSRRPEFIAQIGSTTFEFGG